MQILILLLYFQRPRLVRNALQSVLRADAHHSDWQLAFIDDGSTVPGEPIAREILASHLDKVVFLNTGDDADAKRKHGCRIGTLMNKAIEESSADLGIMLGDDDILYPTYLADLDKFFTANPSVKSAYSKAILLYDPLDNAPLANEPTNHPLNYHSGPICGQCKVDSSQVAWRLECCKTHGAWFESPRNSGHDGAFYAALWDRTGPMHPTGFIGQYKGMHAKQLGLIGPEKAWKGEVE